MRRLRFGSRSLRAQIAEPEPKQSAAGLPEPKPGEAKVSATQEWNAATTRFMYERRSLRWWEAWDVLLLGGVILGAIVGSLGYAIFRLGQVLGKW